MRSVNTVSKSVSRGVRSRTLGETLELDLRGLLITLIEAVNTSGPPAMHGRHWMARSRRSGGPVSWKRRLRFGTSWREVDADLEVVSLSGGFLAEGQRSST